MQCGLLKYMRQHGVAGRKGHDERHASHALCPHLQVDTWLEHANHHTLSVFEMHAGSGQDNPQVDTLKCGRWAQNNDLYGGNALIPFLDFCQIAGNQCNPKGAAAAPALASALGTCPSSLAMLCTAATAAFLDTAAETLTRTTSQRLARLHTSSRQAAVLQCG